MNIQQALNHITKNIHLTQAQMEDVMRSIMQGEATEAQIGALMMGLRMKGESIDEITAAARVMRDLAIKIDVSDINYLVDIVGTGGDGQNLFNVSTASSFVIAAAGEEILIPSEQTPPSLNQNQPKHAEPAKRDALEGLINQVT